LLYQSTQAMVAYSMSAMVFSGWLWKGPGRMHSVFVEADDAFHEGVVVGVADGAGVSDGLCNKISV
jgi:hypothetical protein